MTIYKKFKSFNNGITKNTTKIFIINRIPKPKTSNIYQVKLIS